MLLTRKADGLVSEQKSNNILQGWISALGARFLIGFLFFFAFFMGCWVAGAGLHDPDTCWLLAMGKYVFETGSVPSVDPFSYTFSALTAGGGAVDFAALSSGSSTGSPRLFVPYQWLTELVFYLAYKVGAGYALLTLVDCVLVTALLVGPLMFFRSLRAPMLPAVCLVILGVVAASFHFLARPEIFSYLFFLVMLGLTVRVRLGVENNQEFQKADLKLLFKPALLMVFWANMHTGFMSAFITLSIFCVTSTIEAFSRPLVKKKALVLPWILFLSLIAASMINPFGPRLWAYVPELFFSPLNRYINELSSIKLSHLAEWTFYPFFLFALVVLVVLAKVVGVWRKNGKFPIGWSFSVASIIGVLIAAICCMRLIPFVVVFLLTEVAWLLKGHTRFSPDKTDSAVGENAVSAVAPASESTSAQDAVARASESTSAQDAVAPASESTSAQDAVAPASESSSAQDAVAPASDSNSAQDAVASAPNAAPSMNARVTGMLNYGSWPGILLALSLFGVFMISTRVVEPTIPQGSGAFPAPFNAMRFLSKGLPVGKVFNDAQLGDMMIWYLIAQEKPLLAQDPYKPEIVKTRPKVFIDTRFDMYGAPLVGDYYVMRNAKQGWQQLFERYKFDWVFLPTKANLVKELSQSADWQEVYREKSAVIFVRKNQ